MNASRAAFSFAIAPRRSPARKIASRDPVRSRVRRTRACSLSRLNLSTSGLRLGSLRHCVSRGCRARSANRRTIAFARKAADGTPLVCFRFLPESAPPRSLSLSLSLPPLSPSSLYFLSSLVPYSVLHCAFISLSLAAFDSGGRGRPAKRTRPFACTRKP